MTQPDLTQEQLLELARRRDPEAVASLYQHHVESITRYIGYRVSDREVIEDLTATVFLKMVEKLPDFRPTGAPFEAWLYRIAATQVADYYRIAHRRPQVELQESFDSQQAPVEAQVQQAQESQALQIGLEQLSEEQQTILFLRFVERLSHEEVARVLGKNPQSVATAQHRALKRLAELLNSGEDRLF